jgi:hypothetical protein
MFCRLAAEAVVLVHLGFVAFAVFGALLLARWPGALWLHLPALAWGVWIELSGAVCPLTPLEHRLRECAGQAGYAGGFVEHYLVPLLYPPGLQAAHQLGLAAFLVLVNVLLYAWLAARYLKKNRIRHDR